MTSPTEAPLINGNLIRHVVQGSSLDDRNVIALVFKELSGARISTRGCVVNSLNRVPVDSYDVAVLVLVKATPG